MAEHVGDGLADDASDARVALRGYVGHVGVGGDAGRGEQGHRAGDLRRQVKRAIAAGELAGLAEGVVSGGADPEHLIGDPDVAPRGERGGELGLHGDGREPSAHHVVDVLGEAQPLTGHGQRRLAVSSPLERDDHVHHPQRALHHEDQEDGHAQAEHGETGVVAEHAGDHRRRDEDPVADAGVEESTRTPSESGDNDQGGADAGVTGEQEGQWRRHDREPDQPRQRPPRQRLFVRVQPDRVAEHQGARDPQPDRPDQR